MNPCESPESSFIRGQIALLQSECRQLLEFPSPRSGLQELYERPFQHIRASASFYREHGVTDVLLFAYLDATERLEAAIDKASRQT